jgi:cytochrome P450
MPPELDAHLLNTDTPDHTRLRRLVNGVFTPRRTEQLRAGVQAATDQLLDRMAAKASADIVADLAMPLSMAVICELLGVPVDNRPDFRAWTNTLLDAADTAARSREVMLEMYRFLSGLVGAKRHSPTDDLLSALIRARDDEDRLSEDELVAMAFLLLFGGYNNTGSLIATTVFVLLTHPGHLADLRAGELSMEAVIEETLRWNSPTMLAVRRFATEDITIGHTPIRQGERVWLSWAAANRDPLQYSRPDDFDPTRTTSHLAFGRGAHYCPGAALARLETNVAVTSLIRRFPSLTLARPADELQWTPSLRSRSLLQLPVSL